MNVCKIRTSGHERRKDCGAYNCDRHGIASQIRQLPVGLPLESGPVLWYALED